MYGKRKMNTAQIHSSRRMASISIQRLKRENTRNTGFTSSESKSVRPESREAEKRTVGCAAVSMAQKLRGDTAIANKVFPQRFLLVLPEAVAYKTCTTRGHEQQYSRHRANLQRTRESPAASGAFAGASGARGFAGVGLQFSRRHRQSGGSTRGGAWPDPRPAPAGEKRIGPRVLRRILLGAGARLRVHPGNGRGFFAQPGRHPEVSGGGQGRRSGPRLPLLQRHSRRQLAAQPIDAQQRRRQVRADRDRHVGY